MTTVADVSRIPQELLPLPHWVGWRAEQRNGKSTKVPVDPKSGHKADTTDANTWGDSESAIAAVEKFKLSGIGFVFTGAPYTGVDLDDCRDPKTGVVQGWAMDIIKQLDSYTEASPSGRGVHIFVRGKLPAGRRRKGKVEMYDTGRYFTMTGHHIPGTPTSIEDRQAQLEALHERVFRPVERNWAANSNVTHMPPVSVDDRNLIDRASQASNGDKFRRLWSGRWDGDYASQSEAEQALCNLLAFWTGKDRDRIDRLFRQSGLMREKWERQDYRERTIRAACDSTTQVWTSGTARRRANNFRNDASPAATTNDDASGSNDLPEIDAGNQDLPVVTAEAWDALLRANETPLLFRYGGLPTRIEQDDEGTPVPRALTDDRLRHELARAARWVRWVRREGGFEWRPAFPPMAVVRDMLAKSNVPLPVLTAIIEAPSFGRDGSLHNEPGYHPTGLTFYAPRPGFEVPTVPAQPTPSEVDRAKRIILDDLLGDFPFVNDCERVHAVELLILPFVRALIDGPTPLHLIEKPAPGTGATLLTDVLIYPATGRPIAAMTEGRDEDEWRKRLTAKLRAGSAAVLIDNLKRPLVSASVAAAITSTVWEDRILGTSDMTRLPVRCAWIATGNNPTLSSEIARRTVRIRLDAKRDRPWLRDRFRHSDLRQWVSAHRHELVAAALTLVRAWIAVGKPDPTGLSALGMFESWSRVMGGILQVAGVPGFLSNLSDFYESTDTEGEMVRSFLAAWWEQYQDKELGVADLYRLCSGEDGRILDLGDGTERSQKTRLGKLLGDLRDRHYQLEDDVTVRISLAGTLRRARQWRLDTASGEAENVHQVHHDGGDGGEPGEPGEHFPLASSAAEDLESH